MSYKRILVTICKADKRASNILARYVFCTYLKLSQDQRLRILLIEVKSDKHIGIQVCGAANFSTSSNAIFKYETISEEFVSPYLSLRLCRCTYIPDHIHAFQGPLRYQIFAQFIFRIQLHLESDLDDSFRQRYIVESFGIANTILTIFYSGLDDEERTCWIFQVKRLQHIQSGVLYCVSSPHS